MKKRNLLIAGAMVFIPLGIIAAPLTPDQALQRIAANGPNRLAAKDFNSTPVFTFKTDKGNPATYIFNKTNGFIILSADDKAMPVLGYSNEGTFDPNNIPPQMEWWLSQYALEIEAAPDVEYAAPATRALYDPSWTEIPVMVTTKWGQDDPFYDQCPKSGNRHAPTGCVATSMAQVMNYHKWPEKGQGTKKYNSGSLGGELSINFAAQPFQWDLMDDYYLAGNYTDAQKDAVAYLMKACGYSVDMQYTASSSGANSLLIRNAMITYFDYDPNFQYIRREFYTTTEWTDLIYNNLKNVGPVIYDGNDPSGGGHSFVCDGYDGNGYFHINWGWNGMSDGYFTLNNLTPDALGTGGGDGGGFIFDQGACLGIQKPNGEPAEEDIPIVSMSGALKVDNIVGNTLYLGQHAAMDLKWMNAGTTDISNAIGLAFENIATGETVSYATGRLGSVDKLELKPGSYYAYYQPYVNSYFQLIANVPQSLPDGEYKAIAVTRDYYHPNDPWQEIRANYGYPNFVYVKKENGIVTATNAEIPDLIVEEASINSKLYYSRNFIADITLTNDTDLELTYSYCVVLFDNDEPVFQGTSSLITVEPHSTTTAEWLSPIVRIGNTGIISEPTEFTLGIYNDSMQRLEGTFGTVIMEKDPGIPSIQLSSISLENCQRVQEEIQGEQQFIYLVKTPEDFTANVTLKVTRGYFDSAVAVGISQLAGNFDETIPVVEELFKDDVLLGEGESKDLVVPVSFPEMTPGNIYYLEVKYYTNYQVKKLGQLKFRLDTAGVEGINYDNDVIPEYYNLQGLRITQPQKGQVIIEKRGNKTIKRIF